MTDRIMVKHLPVVEHSFASVIADNFRSILFQEKLHVERRNELASDEEYSLCAA